MAAELFQPEYGRFSARYAAMSDQELLKIAQRSWELSDAAWDALEDELESRGLELPEPESPPLSVVPEQRNLIMLRRFRDLPEAMLAKGKLDCVGIHCVLADENMVRMDWLWSNLLGGVKIMVDAEDFAQASAVLNEPIPADLELESEEIYEQPRCPNCQSLDVSFQELDKTFAFGTLFLGLPIPFQRQGWICHACGHAWKDDDPPVGTEPGDH